MNLSLQHELKRIINILKSQYRPEKIILYGSAATGKVDPDSDLDIVIIKETTSRFYDRIGEVLRLTRPTEAIDVLVYTPEEYERLKTESWFVGEEIQKKGKVIYAI